jgi:hypothetical protein
MKVRRNKKSVRKAKVNYDQIESEADRLTDKHGRLKFMKTSKYLQTLTQGETK